MSTANFGFVPRTQLVTNATAAAIPIPATAAGAALCNVPMVQTDGAVEQVLVVGPGLWAITARGALDPVDAAQTIEYAQAQILDSVTGVVYGASAAIFGATSANAANVLVYVSINMFLRVEPGTTASLAYRFRGNGIPAGQTIIIAGGNNPFLRAILIADA